MNISIFGLGYVGIVSCACFAKSGHKIYGVDVSDSKIEMVNKGKSPIIEKDLDELIDMGVNKDLITATKDCKLAVLESDLSIVCVGTPSLINGSIDLSYIYSVCTQIGEALKHKDTFHTVVIRSTVKPGTLAECGKIIEETSGKKLNEKFGMVSNPEFLREGSAIFDFYNPPYTIIGTTNKQSENDVKSIYNGIDAPIICIKPEESEMIKYANNNFHAVKITFANELGNICKALDIDGQIVMDIVTKDTKLNLSPYYMKPGFAFGGSCLPKDVRGLSYNSKTLDVKTPMLDSILESNDNQIKQGLQLVYNTQKKKIGILGFAFKEGTDDLRESPMVTLLETLIGKGFDVCIYDSSVVLSNLLGKNKDYINQHIPHISKLMVSSMNQIIDHAEVIVIGNKSKEFSNILDQITSDQIVIDFVRINSAITSSKNYQGICW